MSSRPSNTPPISAAQHAKVREQLGAILKLINAGLLDKASAQILPLLRKYPALHETNHVASGYYARTGEHEKAIYYATPAADLAPNIAQYSSALGILLVQAEKHQDAIAPLERALSIDPDHAPALSALGIVQLQLGHINNAKSTLDRAIAMNPNDTESIMNRALLDSDIAQAHLAVQRVQNAIDLLGPDPLLYDALCMYSCYDDELAPQQVADIHRAFGKCVESRVRKPGSYPHDPNPTKRIRIGFVSSDFKEHSISYFLLPIFEHINHDEFELCIYATSKHQDRITTRLKACADLWRDCTQGIAKAHQQIVNDRVDILVELNGHFASNLLPLFAAKPSPVSISAIGYAATTGLSAIDARIVDEITDPSPCADALSTETLARVPGCFLCYQPSQDAPEIEPPSTDRPFTFGSFNDLRKMSPSCLRTWATILTQCPSSRLVLKSSRLGQLEIARDIHNRFKQLDIDPSRITLLGRTSSTRDHLALYNQIDCSLDTFPYTGTTTTCESLWMGVPTITLMGQSHASRVSASINHAINRKDLNARDQAHYIELAKNTADAGLRTAESRNALRAQVAQSSLVDAPAYTRKLETIYRDLWTSYCSRVSQPKGAH